jgi:UDP-glucose 4-epimerase
MEDKKILVVGAGHIGSTIDLVRRHGLENEIQVVCVDNLPEGYQKEALTITPSYELTQMLPEVKISKKACKKHHTYREERMEKEKGYYLVKYVCIYCNRVS